VIACLSTSDDKGRKQTMRINQPRRRPPPAVAVLSAVGAIIAACLATPAARAEEGERFPPVRDDLTLAECSDCHMAFPPALLPARSWQALMAGLDNHFGENASIDAATAAHITDYLVANAADTGGKRRRVLRGLAENEVPLRISETPWWIRRHSGEVRPGAFEDPRVGSKANCGACHRDAVRGVFEDD